MVKKRRTALVTGASAGIGKAFSEVFAENGYDTVLVARRRERLETLAADVERRWRVDAHPIPLDLSDPESPEWLADRLERDGITVDALVNNAGYGLGGSFAEVPWEEYRDFLQVLAISPARLCRLFLPGMRERGFGRVINVASVAAFVPPRPGDSYSAVKSYLVRLSKSLALAHAGTGVHVTALCPGFTHTEFHDVLGIRDEVEKLPAFLWMDADTVARQGYEAVMRGRRVMINGLVNRMIVSLTRIVPEGLLYRLAIRNVLKPRPRR
jgi:short-subunit dehydrogenase